MKLLLVKLLLGYDLKAIMMWIRWKNRLGRMWISLWKLLKTIFRRFCKNVHLLSVSAAEILLLNKDSWLSHRCRFHFAWTSLTSRPAEVKLQDWINFVIHQRFRNLNRLIIDQKSSFPSHFNDHCKIAWKKWNCL